MGTYIKHFDDNHIVNLYNEGLSAREIAKILNTSYPTILLRLRNNNVIIRNKNFYGAKRTYSLNENFFENINTEQKAYILGLIYADGNISIPQSKNNKLRITLHEQDSYLLERIKIILNYGGSLLKKEKANCLAINSKKICLDLNDKGVFPAKSLILKFPTTNQVPTELIRHFIRGYFDGDGSVFKSKSFLIFDMLGTNDFLSKVREIFINDIDCSKNVNVNKAGSICSLRYGRSIDVQKIFAYLYKDSGIYLERKYNKFIEYFNTKNNAENKENSLG